MMMLMNPNHNHNISNPYQPQSVYSDNNITGSLVSDPQNPNAFIIELQIKCNHPHEGGYFSQFPNTVNESVNMLINPRLNIQFNTTAEQNYHYHPVDVSPNTFAASNQVAETSIMAYSPHHINSPFAINEDNNAINNNLSPINDDEDQRSIGSISRQSKKISKQTQPISTTLQDVRNQPARNSRRRRCTKRRPWNSDEDAIVLQYIATTGRHWSQIAALLKNRTGKQVRDRFLNILQPDIRFDKWTTTEDEQLMTLYQKHGKKWSKIASQMAGRSEVQVKSRFYAKVRSTSEDKDENKSPLAGANSLPYELTRDDVLLQGGSSFLFIPEQASLSSTFNVNMNINNLPGQNPVYLLSDVRPQEAIGFTASNIYTPEWVQELCDDPDRFISFNNENSNSKSDKYHSNDKTMSELENLLALDLQDQ